MRNNEMFYNLIKYFFYISIFLLSYILFYNQVFSFTPYPSLSYPSDLCAHISFIDKIINGDYVVPHPLFHYITYFVSKITTLSLKISAILVNTSLVIFLAILIHIIINKNTNKYLKLFLIFAILYSGTPYLPGLNLTEYQYIGNESISIWHNVTLYMVKPFAFISFFLFTYIIFSFKHLSERSIFSVAMLLCGIILFALFAESGARCYDANFSWSYVIVQQIVYLSIILDFVNNYENIKYKNILTFSLAIQVVFGIYYFIKIFFGHGYL